MKIALVHLSDIHLRDSSDYVLKRPPHIASAVKSIAPHVDAYLLVVTGDVSFSGNNAQYALASQFLQQISGLISGASKPVFEVLLPGNHDLNFSLEPDTRRILLESIRAQIDVMDAKGETVRQILSVQKPFFEFEASMLKLPVRSGADCLLYSHSFKVDATTIRVNCFNTAWVSTNPEVAGQLVFPIATLDTNELSEGGLVISVFHHPYNWLVPDNARLFRRLIESSSDVVLTGHEHESSMYEKQNVDGSAVQYIEGAVLQESDSNRSGFNVILIDTGEASYEPFVCQWNGEMYAQSGFGPRSFVRNKLLCKSVFRNNREFLKFLSDPGLPILHPHKRDIALEDLFVYPALAQKNPERKFEVFKIIESQEVVEHVRSASKLLIVGEDTSGKTSLAKQLYRDLQTDGGLVPVFVFGEEFEGHQESNIRKTIRNAIVDQYDESSVDRFFRLDHAQRVLILDDWHHVRYSAKGRVNIMENLKALFGRIICFSNRIYAFEELADAGPFRRVLEEFHFCEIKEFGKRLTGKLIEKWHALGREYSVDRSEFNRAVASSEQKIGALIGKGVLPTYPIFLIGLLQADSSPAPSSQSAGSYGHIIEALITARLAEVTTRNIDIGLLYTYASRLAYSIFKKDRHFLSSKEINDIHDEYCRAYKLAKPVTRIISDLIKARILCTEADRYQFTYPGCYCYFVARYFAENINPEGLALRRELDEITDRLACEDFTNIVMFFLYLTRDAKTIDRLLANAKTIYEEWDPADLESDVQFVNKLLKEKPKKLLLLSPDIEANRDQFRGQQDAVESQSANEQVPDLRSPYNPALSELTKLAMALQTIRVMGQVLRNFPGVLTAEPKYRLAEATYLLGLRTLRRLLGLAEQNLEELRSLFAQIFKEKHPLATTEEVEKSADQKLIWLTGAACYGMIKKVSSAVGLEDLELTFEEVKKNLGDTASVRLIDLAIQLEYFRQPPEADIYDLEKQIRKNLFAYKILRDLVTEFLYLYNTDTKVFQRLGEQFQIGAKRPQFMLNKAVGVS